MSTLLNKSKDEIFGALEHHKVLSRRGIAEILKDLKTDNQAPQSLSVVDFIDFLSTEGKLSTLPFTKDKKERTVRYVWGDATTYECALSLGKRAYLTHASALYIHGLTDEIPRTIYVNAEQSPKQASHSQLTQDGIDRAFSKPQRASTAHYSIRRTQIVRLEGKFTEELEVTGFNDNDFGSIRVTKIERTLIDIAVRPAYAGGIYHVIEAYQSARDQASVAVILSTLKKLDFIYPYHQCIGFLMERAGFPEKQLQRFLNIPQEFDFYLTYGMADKEYSNGWKLYYPKGL